MDTITTPTLYERDFAAWSADQAARLRLVSHELAALGLDVANLAEEIESLGRSEFRELESRLTTIVEHLLKLECSPSAGPRDGWAETVWRSRAACQRQLRDCPSLVGRARPLVAFADGSRDAAQALHQHKEHDAAELTKQVEPYTLAQLLDDGFWPVNRHGIIDP